MRNSLSPRKTLRLSLVMLLYFGLNFCLVAENLQVLTEDLRPFSYLENGRAKGLAVEIVAKIMKKLGYNTPILVFPWARAYYTTLTTPDVALFSMARTPDREKKFQWVGPLVADDVYFYQRSENPLGLRNLTDARNKTIIVTRDYPEQKFLESNGFTHFYLTTRPSQNWKMLMHQRGDLTVSGEIPLAESLRADGIAPGSVKRTGVRLFRNVLYIAFSKSTSPDEVKKWQETLDEMKADGEFDQILNKYLTVSRGFLTQNRARN